MANKKKPYEVIFVFPLVYPEPLIWPLISANIFPLHLFQTSKREEKLSVRKKNAFLDQKWLLCLHIAAAL